MINHREVLTSGETDVLVRFISDPVEMLLEYRLIALDTPKAADLPQQGYYGEYAEVSMRYCIMIVSTDIYGYTDTAFLYDISRDEQIAKEILKILYDGAVTPITAKHIVEDLL